MLLYHEPAHVSQKLFLRRGPSRERLLLHALGYPARCAPMTPYIEPFLHPRKGYHLCRQTPNILARAYSFVRLITARVTFGCNRSNIQIRPLGICPPRSIEPGCFFLGGRVKIFMITEKKTGVKKIPKKVTPIIPAKTAVPNA
jgi:hypothetical protein